jgi:putative endonuclease
MSWFVYIVRCSDDSLYTGITTDVNRREKEHNTNNSLGAKSLRGKRPVKMVYFESHLTQSEARKREAAIKKWKREYKLKLIEKNQLGKFS